MIANSIFKSRGSESQITIILLPAPAQDTHVVIDNQHAWRARHRGLAKANLGGALSV